MRRQVAVWLGYLIATALIGSILAFVDSSIVSPPVQGSMVSDWYAGLNSEIDNVRIEQFLEEAEKKTQWETYSYFGREWDKGVAEYLAIVRSADGGPWIAPSAGVQRTGSEYADLMPELWSLTIDDAGPFSENWQPKFDLLITGAINSVHKLPFDSIVIEPLVPFDSDLELHLREHYNEGLLGLGPKRERIVGQSGALTLLESAQGASSGVSFNSRYRQFDGSPLTIRRENFDIGQANDNVNPNLPTIVRTQVEAVQIFEGRVSGRDLDPVDHILVQRDDEYVAVVVFGDDNLSRRIACIRDDTGQPVGVYHDELPVYAAASNAWASLRCRVAVHDLDHHLNYKLLAHTGRRLPGRELVLEIIGNHLTKHEIRGMRLSGPQAHSVVTWLEESLGAIFSTDDLRLVDSKIGKELVEHLANQSPGESE